MKVFLAGSKTGTGSKCTFLKGWTSLTCETLPPPPVHSPRSQNGLPKMQIELSPFPI